jgi:outer membrane protein assembly factor BamB
VSWVLRRISWFFQLVSRVLGDRRSRFGASVWKQFHADGPSQGFTGVRSEPALQPKWSVEIGPVSYSSPAVGDNGTIYVGTTDGRLVAVSPDGVVLWTETFNDSVIVTSPAVGEDGNVYIVLNFRTPGRVIPFLVSFTSAGEYRWVHAFMQGLPTPFTTASVKCSGTGSDFALFLPLILSNKDYDPLGGETPENGLNELLVLQESAVVDRKIIGGCLSARGSGGFGFLDDLWDFLSGDWTGEITSEPLYEQLGWLQPTVAIVNYRSLVTGRFAVVADTCHGLRLTGFKVSWPAKIHRLWTYEDDSDENFYSSPAVFPSGLTVIGCKDGRVQAFAYDASRGPEERLWEYDAGEAVMATPASFGRQVYVASLRHLHVLDYNGDLLHKTALAGQSVASPALSGSFVYVSTTGGLQTFRFDLSDPVIATGGWGGLSSPAVGKDGTIYAVLTDESKKWFLRAYGGD